MSTSRRETPRGRAGARAALLLAGALAIGCARGADPTCTSTGPEATALPTATATASASAAKLAATSAPGGDAPSMTMMIAAVGDDHVLPLEATRGTLDEPLVLVALGPRTPPPPPPAPPPSASGAPSAGAVPPSASSARSVSAAPPPPPPSPGKERVTIAITSAFEGGGAPVPLRVVDPMTGRDVTSVEASPGQHVYLRVVGDGFEREATYRANLTLFGAEPQVYRLRIKSTAPYRPLGLRAVKWSDTFDEWPIFERKPLRLVLPVESAGSGTAPYHIVVKPPAETIEGTKPLPACGVVVRPIGRDDAIAVELPPLDTGRFAGVIQIQGEALAVDLTLKNSFWVVWLLVAAGAVVSLLLREYVRYRTAREAVERKIAAKEREIEKKKDSLLAWDEVCARNVVRMARGRKSYLALDDAEDVLPDATPRERPERVAIDKTLAETALPEPFRARLRARFLRIAQLSSRADVAEIERGIAEMARAAQEGFSSDLLAWLHDLRKDLLAAKDRLAPALVGAELSRDPKGVARVREALRVFGLLLDDARALALDGGLSPGQALVIGGMRAALHKIEGWSAAGQIPADIVELIHADLGAIVAAAGDARESVAPIPRGLRIRARGVGEHLNAQEEILFEIVEADGPLDAARAFETDAPIEWIVDRRTVVARGGVRLSFVFEAAVLWAGFRSRRVIARAQRGVLAEWQGEIRRPERSIAVVERLWSSAARLGATLVGVIVAGAAAVGILWSGKAFGSAADYVGALLTGLGADLTVVAGGGKLLTTVLDAFTKRKEGSA